MVGCTFALHVRDVTGWSQPLKKVNVRWQHVSPKNRCLVLTTDAAGYHPRPVTPSTTDATEPYKMKKMTGAYFEIVR